MINRQLISTVWVVTREYAEIAEAGGVKNVACSLSEGLSKLGKSVTVFIPRYGCVSTPYSWLFSSAINVAGMNHVVDFSYCHFHGVKIVFVDSSIFREKHAVYTYTEAEARVIPGIFRGKGHLDVDVMNMIFQKAVLLYAIETDTAPDVLHCQDAHTALIPALIRNDPAISDRFSNTRLIVTIHNAGPGYRQTISGITRGVYLTGLDEPVLSKGLFNDNVEPFLLASEYGSLSTVSPWYADELTSHLYNQFTEGLSGEFEKRGVKITGITNGIDYHKYDPEDTSISLLPYAFNPREGNLQGKYDSRNTLLQLIQDFSGISNKSGIICSGTFAPSASAVYFSYHGRIASQKGLDVLAESACMILDKIPEARFIILGQGDSVLESQFVEMSMKYVGRFVFMRGYERALARLAVAVADFIVLPSMFEPCGLEDYIGQIYGTIPVAHAVGGLQKIMDGKNGYLYSSVSGNDSQVLAELLVRLAEPIILSGGIGCASVPEYLAMIRFAADNVVNACNWDSIIRDHYMSLYGE